MFSYENLKRLKIYGGAYLSSLLSMVAMIFLTSLFARSWPEEDFLNFTVLLRYASLLIVVSSFCLGFSIVRLNNQIEMRTRLFPTAFWFVIACAAIVHLTGWALQSDIAVTFFFVAAGAVFHILVSALRFDNPLGANLTTIKIKFGIVFFSALLCVAIFDNPKSYFVLYGMIALAMMVFETSRNNLSLNPFLANFGALKALLSHSFTRAMDNFARITFHMLPVWLASELISVEIAGLVAIAILFTKSLESSIQPLVMQLYIARTKGAAKFPKYFKAYHLVLAGLALLSGLVLLYLLSDHIVALWLTPSYQNASELIKIGLLGLPFSLGIQFYRAMMEAESASSPFYIYNLLTLLLMLTIGSVFLETAADFMYLYSVSFLVRFLIFTALFLKGSNMGSRR